MLPLAAERELVLMQVPKSLDLFELYLASATFTAGPGRRIAAAFQTRHFSPKMVEIAEKYAGTVNQSRAYKKARLLILADLKPGKIPEELYRQVAYRETNYYQYYGVFSAKHIDYATQYLLDEFKTNHLLAGISNVAAILDIGSGNGVILDQLGGQFAGSRLLATEVSAAAVASTSQNVLKAEVHLSANLSSIADGTVDLIVTNPPFHDGHKNAIEPTIELFKEAKTKLTERGHFVVVANRHLNYVTHLDRLFEEVIEVADNGKFMVYRCSVD
jgi:16S rRNA G1207 methylase RsmC